MKHKKLITALLIVAYVAIVGAILAADVSTAPSTAPVMRDAVTIETQQYGYIDLRGAAGVSSADTALTFATKTWDDCKGIFYRLPRNWTNVSVSYYCYGDGDGAGDPNDGTFDSNIYLIRPYGPAKLLYSEDSLTCGSVRLSTNPVTGVDLWAADVNDPNYCWVDTIPDDSGATWPVTIQVSGGGGTTSGSDQAEIWFDPLGAYGIYVEIENLTNVTTVFPVATGCSG